MAGFDVATGALGLVSVGIQAFSGILDYYHAYKDFDDDIAQILLQAGILRSTLWQLDEKLRLLQSPKSPLTPQAECAVVSIQHCEHGINRVNAQLEKCRSSLRSEPVSKARHRLDRMLYPFRKEKLKELLKILDSLKANINNSAGMVHLAVSMANSEKADLMISKSESTMDAVHVLSQQQQDTNHKLDQMQSMMREMASVITHHKAQPILDPTSLRLMLEAKKQLETATPRLSYLPYDDASLAAQNHSPSRCGCRNHNSSRGMVRTQHEAECPLYQPTTRVASFGIQWAVLDKISSFSVRSFFGSTRGAGGFSISPNLQLHPEVAPSSPSFDLLVKYLDSGCGTSLPKFKKSLEELFKKGEASPRDTLPTGETLLHVATKSMLRHCSSGSPHSENWQGLISGLIWMGVEGNSLCLSGRTPVDQLISFAAGLDEVDGNVQKLFKDIIICLCSYGSFISTGAFEITHFTGGDTNPPIVEYIQSFAQEGLSDDVYVPDELLPLIHRSADDLHNKLGATFNIKRAVDFYVTWPAGLSILLNSGIIPSQSAFHFTCSNGYEESVDLLIETNALPISGEILRDVSLSPNEQIRDAIIQTFVLRRRHLQALLERHLTEQEMTQLRIRPGSLPGYNSGKAHQLLKAKSINCVYPEDKSSWLIYDIFSENSVLADQLWESGFRDVEEVDNKGWNSVSRLCFSEERTVEGVMQKVGWFLRRGASLHIEPGVSSKIRFLVVHFLLMMQCELQEQGSIKLRSGIENYKEVLHFMLFDTHRDTCRCYCSSNGCNNFVRAVFSLFNMSYLMDPIFENSGLGEKGQAFLDTVKELIGLLDPGNPRYLYDQLAPVMIRFLTFHTMELTHTCICLREDEDEDGIPSGDELEQIQREECDQLIQLDELVDEFLCRYNELDQELPEFIEGYWCFRMQEVLSGVSRGLTPEEIQNIRGLGMILHDV